jgi:argininosuccinate lyase
MKDKTVFPDAAYRDNVLAPLFDGVKTHYAGFMADINQAHLVMLRETDILSAEDAAKLAHALRDIDNQLDLNSLNYTGEHEDYFFFVEAELKSRLGDLGGSLHTARSRNDMDHTVFKLALRHRAEKLLAQSLALAEILIDKAEAEKATPIVAYTHGQPAQPSTFGHYLAAMIEVLLRDIERLQAAINGLDHCPMGAAAITTSGFPIDRERMAELLGFSAPLLNSYGCIASVDYVTGLYSAIKLLFLHLGRVVQDMAFWSSFEVGQLYVPNSLVQISSIMPQKRNPVPIEHMRHLASATVGRCDMVVNIMHNTPFTDMNDSEGEVQQAGYAAFESGERMMRLLSAFMPACQIRQDNVRRNANAACVTVTELADCLVRSESLTFRQAHEVAALTAQSVIKDGCPLGEGYAAFKSAFEAIAGRASTLDEQAFTQAVSIEGFIACRDRTGGPAPSAMDAAIALYRTGHAQNKDQQEERLGRYERASNSRQAAFAQLMET